MTEKTEKSAADPKAAGDNAKPNEDMKPVDKNVTGSVDASGAIQEAGAVPAETLDHPAVDNNPRADTTAVQNQADFNDPHATDQEAVMANLGLEPSDEPLQPAQREGRMVVVDGSRTSRR